MAEQEDSGFSWSDFVDGFKNLGVAGGEVFNAWTGASSDEEAYLRGQLAGIQQTQQSQRDSDTVKLGGVEISTSSLLWIIGGTLGLLTIGIAAKKLF